MLLWTAFTIGLLGSLHCVGMCGPIAMAMPYQGTTRWATGLNILRYHLGRILTYALLGGLIGLLGRGLFLAGLQQGFSIGAGVLLLIAAIFSFRATTNRVMSIPVVDRWLFTLKSALGRLLHRPSGSSLVMVGMLNGLLPCGLVYVAIVGAVSTGSPALGMGYMALFGLGTVPLLLVASVAGTIANINLRNRLRQLVPVFLVVFAVLLIMRGMQFDVPVGFSFWEATEQQPMCH
ncbi:MAG: sulfite exporter TauE/SafE family protein [Saprospiraceae bacterium]|nr:sulfite exporter TauE/SafE family protein [Saprospiraceae bacterium]